MPIENAQYISQLDIANPSGSDQVAELDNHIRLIKQVLKATFPNLAGQVSLDQNQMNSSVPIGFIGLWSGPINAIPTGWVLCAGQTGLTRSDAQGTINAPDLRNKFLVGAGDGTGGTYAVNATGGALTHNHTGTVSGTAITVAQMPSHTHGVSDPGHGHGVIDPNHSHPYAQGRLVAGPSGAQGGSQIGMINDVVGTTAGAATGISIQAAGTGISVQSNGSGQTHTHGVTVDSASNLPPYLAMAYIMKI